MSRPRTVYTREFKMAILTQVDSGIPVAKVARENGLNPALVFRWKKEFQENPEKAFSGQGHPYKDQARVAELGLQSTNRGSLQLYPIFFQYNNARYAQYTNRPNIYIIHSNYFVFFIIT